MPANILMHAPQTVEDTLSPQERKIVEYHRKNIRDKTFGRDEAGRPVTVYSTGILVPEGPNKGKFVSVPGFFDGRIHNEEESYKKWKREIDAGKWPMYSSGDELNQRSRDIHSIMDMEGNF